MVRLCYLLLLAAQPIMAQVGQDFEVIELDGLWVVNDMSLSPDGENILIARDQKGMQVYDLAKREITREFYPIRHTQRVSIRWHQGDFALLKRMAAIYFNINKPRKKQIDVVEVSTGNSLYTKEDVTDADLDQQHRFLVVLEGNEVSRYDLSGNKLSGFKLLAEGLSLSLSPDGTTLAVGHKPDPEWVKNQPQYKKKKSFKNALKRHCQISFYDVESGKLLYQSNQLTHLIMDIQYGPSGNYLMVYEKPHAATGGNLTQNSYVTLVEGATGKVSRTSFPTHIEMGLVRFKVDPTGQYFGITTHEQGSATVNVYNLETGKMVGRFNVFSRYFNMLPASHPAFAFLTDGKILLGFGNNLALWDYPKE